MEPEAVQRQVLDLVRRLQSGDLAGAGPVDLGDGALLTAPVAARVIIAEARHLVMRLEAGQPVSPWRWRLIANQIERLHLAIQ